jgi:hypothetical protein
MSPTTIRPGIPQPLDISQDLSPQIVLDRHVRKRGIHFEDLILSELAHAAGVMEVVFGEETGGDVRADTKEGL